MTQAFRAGALFAALVAPAGLLAQTAPDRLPLSEILATLEAQPDFGWFESVEWDDDHWEVEYDRADGSEVEVDLDPTTGEPIRR